jgi:formate hydrogenlyase subunit 3
MAAGHWPRACLSPCLIFAWHRHPQVKANGLLVNLLLAAATCAVVATNFGTLVVMAEIMALCGVSHRLRAIRKAVVCAGTSRHAADGVDLLAGVVDLRHPRAGQISLLAAHAQNMLLWLPALVGFALLAGVIPLHGWRRRRTPGPARRPPRCFPRW